MVVENQDQKNIRLVIAYDGTGYFGWQRQLDQPTIQGTIEEKIGLMVGAPVTLIGSGRTDAGVHAVNQVANFRVSTALTPAVFFKGLNYSPLDCCSFLMLTCYWFEFPIIIRTTEQFFTNF